MGQTERAVLIPDTIGGRPRFEWIDAKTGQTRWFHDARRTVDRIVISDKVFVTANNGGHVELIDPRTGSIEASNDLGKSGEVDVAISGDGETAYVAIGETIWALETGTGKTRWQWQWSPLTETETLSDLKVIRPHLTPLDAGIACVMSWDVEVRNRHERVDVIGLSNSGEVLIHRTSPPRQYEFSKALDIVGYYNTIPSSRRPFESSYACRPKTRSLASWPGV